MSDYPPLIYPDPPHTAESGCEAWLSWSGDLHEHGGRLAIDGDMRLPVSFCPFCGAHVSQPEKP